MYEKIRKRNGKICPFDLEKITIAITKAGKSTGEFEEDTARRLAKRVLARAEEEIANKIPTVEQIQDMVEGTLLSSLYRKTAKAYILYREQHAEIREMIEKQQVDLVDKYLDLDDWQVKENSNMAYSLQGLNNYISSEVSKKYWLKKIYSPEICDAYINGTIHIHDLDKIATYCVGWDLQDLLQVGFKGVEGKIESKPAKHFKTALGQIVNFFYTLQGESAGAQAFSNFDTLLAPFIRYDNLSEKEVRQALQEFMFNVNVPTRVGFQTPFTNVTMDLTVPSTLAKDHVIIGGEPKEETYADFQKEMDMFNNAFSEIIAAGDARGRVFTFPIPTYNITKDFDWDNPNLNGFWKMTAKYGIPSFCNYVNSDLKPEDARSMCCRLRLDSTELRKRGGALFGANPLTGSIGVVTINMPRLAYLAKDEEEFKVALTEAMELSRDSLETKRKVIEKLTENGLYPYSKFYLRNIKKRFGTYWENHFSTIGLLGMNEACINLLGASIDTKTGKEFAERTLEFMRDTIQGYQTDTGHYYNLEATPGEGTTFRFASNDKKRYPKIIVANEENYQNGTAPYYTNSSHLPVNYSDDIFHILDHQDTLQTKYTGGTIVHLFIGEEIKSIAALKKLVKKICTNYELPYFTISPTFSVCSEHGYTAGRVEECETCGNPNEVYSRVVGFIRPVSLWNPGKRAEFDDRLTSKVK